MKPDEAFVSVLALVALVGFLAYFIGRVARAKAKKIAAPPVPTANLPDA